MYFGTNMKNIKMGIWTVENAKGTTSITVRFCLIDDETSRTTGNTLCLMEFAVHHGFDLVFYSTRPVLIALLPYTKEIIFEEFLPEYMEVTSLDTTCKEEITGMIDDLYAGTWSEMPDPLFKMIEYHYPHTVH